MRYSIIIPVYNRPNEVDELLASLEAQTIKPFEVILVEDGSTQPCIEVIGRYSSLLTQYITKPNTGRSDSRNVGMAAAKGDWLLFFDSDCILPPLYFEALDEALFGGLPSGAPITDEPTDKCEAQRNPDCFGGPDASHPSFSRMQKAISYAMTSILTTGGIRGGKRAMEKFKPRTFNMGFSRKVYRTVGGFKDMYGEDIDLSLRIDKAGFTTRLIPQAYVYHKRRVSLGKFARQVYQFGKARITLYRLHPESMKVVHTLPALFTVGSVAMVVLATALLATPYAAYASYALAPLILYAVMLLCDAIIRTRSLVIAPMAVACSFVQLYGYGYGFLQSAIQKLLMRQPLEDAEHLKKHYK